MMAHPLLSDSPWLQQQRYEEAEALYQQAKAGTRPTGSSAASPGKQQTQNTKSTNNQQGSTLKSEIAQARQNIQRALNEPSTTSAPAVGDTQLVQRIKSLEDENNNLKKASLDLTSLVKKLEARVAALEKSNAGVSPSVAAPKAPEPKADSGSDGSDFFGSDSESEGEDEELKAKLAAYAAKKAKKPALIPKSTLLLDVKPWDDETDMAELEKCVRTITMDGLLWGASKMVPVGYGIRKLQINAVIEDDKVSTDDLEDKITAFEDLVQSMDIAAFNKI